MALDGLLGIRRDARGVWVQSTQTPFQYSDGRGSERYLETVFKCATDLSSQSLELQRAIRDWPSEYHLTRGRANLLRGLTIPRTRILEFGCGCGAITRYLGEVGGSVVGVEGSYQRAVLARMRTRGQDNVEIVCSPFQDLRLDSKFDTAICIGALEYAASVTGRGESDPYDDVIAALAHALTSVGTLVLAIENQFGLKFFAGMSEEHTGKPYDGIQDYLRLPNGPRTFGFDELRSRLQRYFNHIRFLFPYPDYKIPRAVLAEEFLRGTDCAELVANCVPRESHRGPRAQFDQAAATYALARSGRLALFANSFLIIASKGESPAIDFPDLGVLFSGPGQTNVTQTRITTREGSLQVTKVIESELPARGRGAEMRCTPWQGPWEKGKSIQARMIDVARGAGVTLEAIGRVATPWVTALASRGTVRQGRTWIGGYSIDHNWKNSFLGEHGECRFIDQEWTWSDDLSLGVLALRAAAVLLDALGDPSMAPFVPSRLKDAPLVAVAAAAGIKCRLSDLREFVSIETTVREQVFGAAGLRYRIHAWSRLLTPRLVRSMWRAIRDAMYQAGVA